MAERERCNWVASFSDGSTHTECELIGAGKPAWGSILAILERNESKLTGLRLQRAGITHTAPSSSQHAKFPSNAQFELDQRRRGAQSNKGEEWYCNYTVRLKEYTIKLWVDECTGDTWMQIEKA